MVPRINLVKRAGQDGQGRSSLMTISGETGNVFEQQRVRTGS